MPKAKKAATKPAKKAVKAKKACGCGCGCKA